MTVKFFFASLAFTFFLSSSASAQSAWLDNTFGTGGKVLTSAFGTCSSIAIQPDGKIVATRAADSFTVSRFMPDGTIDSSFAAYGTYAGPEHSNAQTVLLQADGKIVCAGSIQNAGIANSDFYIVRLNADGSRDMTFGSDGTDTIQCTPSNDFCYGAALQADGKILLTGYTASNLLGIVRLQTNGRPDSTFATNGILLSAIAMHPAAVAAMADGRIVIGGVRYDNLFMALRFLSDGTVDTTFHEGSITTLVGGSYNYCHGMLVQADGKVLLAGSGTFAGTGSDFTLFRATANGVIDFAYGSGGNAHIDFGGADDEIWAICAQPDGKVLLAGYTVVDGRENFALSRVDSNGNIDTTFGNNGRIITNMTDSNSRARAIALQPDGKVVAGGYGRNSAGTTNMVLARYTQYPSAVKNVAQSLMNVAVYPNPCGGTLYLTGLQHVVRVEIFDATGRCVLLREHYDGHGIDMRTLNAGVYFVRVTGDDGSAVVRSAEKE